MFEKAPLPKHMMMVIILIIFAIMGGGYGLYYHSKKQMAQKDKEYQLLKEKEMKASENYNDLKKKFDNASNNLEQINKDYEALVQKQQDCKAKQDEIQTKYDTLVQNNEQLEKALLEAQTKLGISPSSPTTTSTTSGNDHPVKLLNKSKDTTSQNNTETTQIAEAVNKGSSCPTPEMVSKNAHAGNWKDNDMSWWVEFTSRPLLENEAVKDLFKMLYDGHSIACYYALNSNTDINTWMVVKADAKKKTFKLSEKGWSLCPTDECKSMCEKASLKECFFTIE